MKRVLCEMLTLGGVEDDYLLPLAETYQLPLYIHRVRDHETLHRISTSLDVCTSAKPYSGAWLSQRLRGAEVIVRALTPIRMEDAEAKHREFYLAPAKDCELVHLTHGGDDRNRADDPRYDTFNVYRKYLDRVVVDNRHWERQINVGMSHPIARCAGNIPLACYLEDVQSDLQDAKPAILEARGLATDRPTVLYAPSWEPAGRDPRLGTGLFQSHGPDICRAVPDALNLIVRPHPHSYHHNAAAVEACRNLANERSFGWFMKNDFDFLMALDLADVIISDHSVVCPTALALDKPLIVFEPNEDTLCDDWVMRFSDVIRSPSELPGVLQQITEDKGWRCSDRRDFIEEFGFVNPKAIEHAFLAIQGQ